MWTLIFAVRIYMRMRGENLLCRVKIDAVDRPVKPSGAALLTSIVSSDVITSGNLHVKDHSARKYVCR